MLLNLSSDKPFIYDNGKFVFFERKELENQLPKFFYENKNNIKSLYVINGPGYFSSTRVGVEVINILLALQVIEKVFYLDKLDFFRQNGFDNIYLFSGNKNKFIFLKENNYDIVFKSQLNNTFKVEELFELSLDGFDFVKYDSLLKDYKNLNWNLATKTNLLKPFYIFEPIVC